MVLKVWKPLNGFKRADMITFVLWKDHYGFSEENGLEKSQSPQEAE